MNIKLNVKRKYKINGKEYTSIEEMPDEVRAVFQKAMDQQAGMGQTTHSSLTKAKIVFNGTEYYKIESMPQDVRQLYEKVLGVAEGGISVSRDDVSGLGDELLKKTLASGASGAVDLKKTTKFDPLLRGYLS